jgi:hypothetical protein
LKVWQKLLGDGNNIENENGVDNIITYRFNAGRFTVTVEFTGTSRLGTSAKISSKAGEPELTLKEATQIMDSLGLTEPKKIAQDPMVDIQPLPDSRSWGTIPSSVETIKDSSLVNAVYGEKDLEHRDNNRRALSIFTRQISYPRFLNRKIPADPEAPWAFCRNSRTSLSRHSTIGDRLGARATQLSNCRIQIGAIRVPAVNQIQRLILHNCNVLCVATYSENRNPSSRTS